MNLTRQKEGEKVNKYNNLPQEVKDNMLFCCWRYENREGKKPIKMPYNPINGRKAQSNNLQTFTNFKTALENIKNYNGLGFSISNGICAFDLDNCFETDGSLKPWAKHIVEKFRGCYIERSPSRNGLRIIFKAPGFIFDKSKYYINNQKLGLEVYISGVTNRFVTVTGDVFCNGDVLNMNEELQEVLDMYMKRPAPQKTENNIEAKSYLSDESVLEKAMIAKNADTFIKLWNGDISSYGSHSEADLALASILAFWCGCDVEQMDRLFRKSGLMREKWDRNQSGTTYGQITLQKAANSTKETYSPLGSKTNVTEEFTVCFNGGASLAELHPQDNPRYSWSDIGNGYLFADYYKNKAQYVPERKMWYIHEGAVWKPDVSNLKTMELCKRLADELMIYALSITDERSRSAYIDFIRRWQSRKNRETILKDAVSVYPISMSSFDSNPYIFNCLNGTLNLKTGEFHEHKAEDMLSKVAGVNYDKNAYCERWNDFITEVMSGDKEKALFLQKAMGYALTGDTRYEVLFILYGPKTRNGKGTTMETFLNIMGSYGKTARPETIGMKNNSSISNNPTEDIARLAGSRFVNISEPDKKLVLSTALVKSLTGNDSINARFLHENSFDFRPQFKLFINTNHLPQVNDLTLFTSGRVKIIPFERHFEESEQDKQLKQYFAKPENLSGILNWCIEGLRMLEQDGLDMPEAVKNATYAYQHSSDKIGLFIEELLIADKNGEVRTSEVYTAYKQWCYENGYHAENMKNFNASIGAVVHIERKRPQFGGEKTTVILGYRLITTEEFIVPLTG